MRVGTRILLGFRCTGGQDHPHACGDKFLLPYLEHKGLGSSPCVWGQVTYTASVSTCVEDHPHACGDKEGVYGSVSATVGSSPCVWGQGPPKPPKKQRHRIIPMRVGTRHCQVTP